MQRMAEFSKVSYDQFKKDWIDAFEGITDGTDPDEVEEHIRGIYDDIELPKRATMQSAGHDFRSPVSFLLEPGDSIKIPTGIRCEMYDGWVMMLYIRSSLGFKYGLSMPTSVSVIDGDYFDADNEGHIMVKLVNMGDKEVKVNKGDGVVQGVFTQFGITLDDDVTEVRSGGLGSTDKKE